MKRAVLAFIMASAWSCLPFWSGWAGTWRDDFDTEALRHWSIYNECIGFNWGGERSVKVENGVVKIKDNSKCSLFTYVGLYRLEPWTDYELTAKLKVIRFLADFTGVNILARAQRCRPKDPLRTVCIGGPPRIGFESGPVLSFRPSNKLFNIQPANIILDQWYEVKIIVKGLNVAYFFEGQKIKEERIDPEGVIRIKQKPAVGPEIEEVIPIDPAIKGGVAFIGSQVEFWLDYVEVIGNDISSDGAVAVESKSKLAATWGKMKTSK